MPSETKDLAASHDLMVKHLVYICDALETAQIPYFLSSGTLLGAVREGDILKTEERDIDLDILHTEADRVLGLNDVIKVDGYEIIDRVPGYADYDIGYKLRDMKADREPVGGAGLLVLHNGDFVGDIFINAIYSDGFVRRQCLKTDASVAAKMTVPAWYYEGHELAEVRGRKYPVPRQPREYLRKTYGHDWETPIPPGGFGAGRHPDSGTVYDSDIERLTLIALENGWDGNYDAFPKWPCEIKNVGSYAGRRWIFKHETFYQVENTEIFTSEETDALKTLLSSELSPFRAVTVNALIAAKSYIAFETAKAAQTKAVDEIKVLKDDQTSLQAQLATSQQKLKQTEQDLVYLKGMQFQLLAERERHAETTQRLEKIKKHPLIKTLVKLKALLRKIRKRRT